MKKIIKIFLILMIIYIIGNSLNNDTKKIEKEYNVLEKNGILIEEIYKEGYYLKGIARNNSGKNYGAVTIRITEYDKHNNKLGTSLDSISDLENGQSWKFEIFVDSEMDDYDINIETY